MPNLDWYCIRTNPRREQFAADNLRRFAEQVLAPRTLSWRTRLMKRERVPGPLFPGYVFGLLNLERDMYHLRRAQGVRSLVSVGDLPIAVDIAVIEEIKARIGADGFVQLGQTKFAALRKGDRLELDSSVLSAAGESPIEVLFDQYLEGEDRVIVLMNLLGRQVRYSFPADGVRVPAFS